MHSIRFRQGFIYLLTQRTVKNGRSKSRASQRASLRAVLPEVLLFMYTDANTTECRALWRSTQENTWAPVWPSLFRHVRAWTNPRVSHFSTIAQRLAAQSKESSAVTWALPPTPIKPSITPGSVHWPIYRLVIASRCAGQIPIRIFSATLHPYSGIASYFVTLKATICLTNTQILYGIQLAA